MNSDTEETTKVSEIEVSALKETRLAAQEKFVLEQERHRFAEKKYWFPLKTYVRMLQPNRCLHMSNQFLLEIAYVMLSENGNLLWL